MSEVNITPVMDDDQILDYTQGKRVEIVKALTKQEIPTDPETARILLQTLDGMDRGALGRKRLKIEDKAADNAGNGAAIVAAFFKARGQYQQPVVDVDAQMVGGRVPPTLGADIPDPELVEGELSQVAQQMSFEQFQKTFGSGPKGDSVAVPQSDE